MSWEEALRINAALVVIGDERADYGEWRAKRGNKPVGDGPVAVAPELTFADWKREADEARAGLEAATKTLQAHRYAIATNAPEGRLVDEDVTYYEERVDEYTRRIELVEAEIAKLVAREGGVDGQSGVDPRQWLEAAQALVGGGGQPRRGARDGGES